MVSISDKALLFRNRDMTWLEETGSPSVGDKGFLVRTEDGNFFLKETSVSIGNKGRLFNIDSQYYLRSAITEPGRLKWSINCSNPIHGIRVTSDGVIFVGTEWTNWPTNPGTLWAINSDGDVKWYNNDTNRPTDNPDYFTDIAFSNDETKLFIGDRGGYLRCFNIVNGTEIWNWSNPYKINDFWGGITIDSYNYIYGAGDNAVISLDEYGNYRWDNQSIGEYDCQLEVDNIRLFICQKYNSNRRGYSALNKDTGLIRWNGGTTEGGAVHYNNTKVYFGTTKEVVCVNPDGSLNWSYEVNKWVYGIIADSDDNCYFQEHRGSYPNYSNCIKKLDENGNLLWEKNISQLFVHDAYSGTRKFAIDDNTLYFSTWESPGNDEYVFALRKSDGNTNWSYKQNGDSFGGTDLSPSNDAYYFSVGNYLYAIET